MDDTESNSPASKVIARGYLEDFSTSAVLQALSISRQYTAVDFYLQDGSAAGRVLLKSGMVLGAQLASEALTGVDALRSLLHEPLHAFQVERLIPPAQYPKPIAQLSTQVLSKLSRPIPLSPAPVPTPSAAAAPNATPTPAAKPVSSRPVSGDEATERRFTAVQPAGAAGKATPVVAVASPKGGCGKTTIALNLAVSLARAGLRVVLVDADPNGDVLSAVGARERARSGIFDVLATGVDPTTLTIRTVVKGLVLVPALSPGSDVPDSLACSPPDRGVWADVFRRLGANADVVLVDTAAGMFGVTGQVVGACTHVLGVLQAETISQRSFGVFDRVLRSMNDAPDVLGVVLNMFRRSHQASLSVLVDASSQMPENRLLQITIPRSDVFLELSVQGAPVACAGRDTRGIAPLFDSLAAEVISRLELEEPSTQSRPTSFLV